MKNQKLLSFLIGIAALSVSQPPPSLAALMINSQSIVVDLSAKEALFTLDFNEVPDFETLDSVGRQASSFQYFIDADGELPVFYGSPYYSRLEAIIRGEEIHLEGDIRVRNALPSDDNDPNSGGWGTLRGSVPFTLNGTMLTFSTPLSLIGDSDGNFSYNLEVYEYGGLTDYLQDQISTLKPKSVLEPSSIFGFLAFSLGSIVLKLK